MTAAPAVAVVIAAHDPGPYLRTTLESVLAQQWREWECVVVDDGSHEDLGWVAVVDERVRLLRQEHSGVAAARNAGAAATSAPVLTFLDQDDLWRPRYLAVQVAALSDDGVDLATTAFDIVDEHGAYVGPGFSGYNSSYSELLQGCGLQCGTVAVRRTAFNRAGGFRDYAISQDWDLWLRLLRGGVAIVRTDEVLGSWRQHGGNASRDYRGLWRDGRTILAQHTHPAARTGRRRLRRLAGTQAVDAARTSDSGRGRLLHLGRALWLAPGYTAVSAFRALWRQASRSSHPGAGPPAPASPDAAPNQP